MTENEREKFWAPMRIGDVPQDTVRYISAIIEKIPELPLSVHKILELAASDTAELDELVKVVSSDPALVSSLLRIVNSSYYGLGRKTENLNLAIVLLGFKEVGKIALKSYMSRNLGEGFIFENYDTRGLWGHSYLVSICAEALISEDNAQKKGLYLTLGLLHDIGKFALLDIAMLCKKMAVKPKPSCTVFEDDYLIEKEEKIFGVNHNIVGGLLARKWNLSERIASVLEHHHGPTFFGMTEIPQEYLEEITTICLADIIVSKYQGLQNPVPEPHAHFFKMLGFTPPIENLLTPALKEKLDKAQIFMACL
jgi:HD-like signal output (HDOD) protein